MAELTRRSFVVGSGIAAGAVAAGTVAGTGAAVADEAPAGSSAVYQTIATEMNPQDYDYRQNSGDLSHVLSPWKFGPYEFTNRICKSAAGSNYENGGWDKFVEYYRRLAAGGVEMIWVENFAHIFLPYTNIINANIDTFADEDVKALTDAIHNEGSICGNQVDTMASGWFSEISSRGGMDAGLLTLEEIQYMIDCYVSAAKQMKEWGFDALEINCAGNNIPQWFLNPSRNTREDEYGAQTFENRVRFIGEIIDGIRAECGEDWPIQVLIDGLQENDAQIGKNNTLNPLQDNIEIAKALEARGVNSLHVRLGPQGQHATQFLGDLFFDTLGFVGTTSYGTQFDFSRHFQGMVQANHSGCGLMLNISRAFKEAVNIPVGTVTYMDPAHAPDLFDNAVADGAVDFLMMNRPLTVDNEYVHKLQEGRLDEIRPCTRCCHCWNDTFKGQEYPLTKGFGMSYCCRLDPIRDNVGQEDKGMPGGFDPDPAEVVKNVMVVGAGPSGMEAARIAAERGHTVTLYEKQGYLGGLMNFMHAIKGPHQNLLDYIAWSEGDLGRKGVTVVTGQEVDAAFIKEQAPDAVILAVGGQRASLGIAGDEGTSVISIDDVMTAEIGQNVTIVGSNCQATDIAVYLLAQGKNVTIVTPDPIDQISKGQSIWSKTFTVPTLYARGVRVWEKGELLAAGGGQATIKPATGTEVTYACDTVIECMDMIPNKDMLGELEGIEAYAVGDCDDPYNIQYGIRAGNFCARTI